MNKEKQIPIYRAKGVDGSYRIGYHTYDKDLDLHYIHDSNNIYQSDAILPSTLSIHMEDMIDSEGTKIFASLSDGAGSDVLNDINGNKFICIFRKHGISIKELCNDPRFVGRKTDNLKVTGIQE